MSWAKSGSDAIRSKWIPHPKFQQAESETLAALLTADPGELIALVGASRVGKSTLIKRVCNAVVGDAVAAPGAMPVVTLVVENNGRNGQLTSKSVAESALIAVQHPIFGQDNPDDPTSIDRIRLIDRTSEATLRTAFEEALKHRRTKYLILDEVHHLLYAWGGRDTAEAMLDSLKCMAARRGIVLILVSAYPILDLFLALPHLIGRKLQIHFERYREDSEKDLLTFDRILLEYSNHLCFSGSNSLRDWNGYLHEGSLGCVGLLRAWIRDALNRAWVSGAAELKREHFEHSRKSDLELQSLAAEIHLGETALRRAEGTAKAATDVPGDGVEVAPKKRRKRGRPFTANPQRFPVGQRRGGYGK